ncbi:MAG TPA: ParB/RepB/Spo0J family partition protein [Candidatus Paceibacterota bacterium]|jgi:ParB family chromosome partitioning protein
MTGSNYIPTKYDSVYWVEVERIEPNPYQPRIDFDEERLKSLAESIRQYGVLQPLVVTRDEREKADGGLQTTYQLIAGERRLRASKLIGLREVPVVIRQGEQSDKMKLELAIIENLQREDLNAIDRAKALAQLAESFGISHAEIAAKIGRSREYVSNSIRLLALPEAIQQAVVGKEITEGHARALLMLTDRPEERDTLFKEIVLKKTSVRMVEQMARRIAQDKIRKHDKTPEVMELEKSLTETLGTRVLIESRPNGGRVLIEFFSSEDLSHIAGILAEKQEGEAELTPAAAAAADELVATAVSDMPVHPNTTQLAKEPVAEEVKETAEENVTEKPGEKKEPEEDLYSVQNFTV